MTTVRVSSSMTIFFKLFIPTVWTVFFGTLGLYFFFFGSGDTPALARWSFRLGFLAFFLLGFLTLYFSLMRLQRVEFGEEGFYVTNYFKTYKYTYESLSGISEIDALILRIGILRFPVKSRFGKRVYFIKRTSVFNQFVEAHPGLFRHIHVERAESA